MQGWTEIHRPEDEIEREEKKTRKETKRLCMKEKEKERNTVNKQRAKERERWHHIHANSELNLEKHASSTYHYSKSQKSPSSVTWKLRKVQLHKNIQRCKRAINWWQPITRVLTSLCCFLLHFTTKKNFKLKGGKADCRSQQLPNSLQYNFNKLPRLE